MNRLAVVVVIDHGGRTLLVKRAPGRPGAGYWTPVTGKVEPGEGLEEAARREAFEEVGLQVEVGGEVHRCPAEGAPFDLVWFEATVVGDASLCVAADELSDARWCRPDEVEGLGPMFEATRGFFAHRGKKPR